MSEVDYRQIIRELPELAAQLAGAIIPSTVPPDGMPRGTEKGDAARTSAIDDLDKLMSELAQSVRFWQHAFSDGIDLPIIPEQVEHITGRQTAAVVSDDPMRAAADAHVITAWLLQAWDDVEGHPLHDWWCESLDDWIVPMVRRLEVRKIRQRPRRCVNCSALDVWADLEHTSALCAACGEVMRAEVWLPVPQVAKQLGVAPSTVRGWLTTTNQINVRGEGRTRELELSSCRHEMELRLARELAGIATPQRSHSVG
ncbi:hypothetical protein [Microbacterium sp.]|uniref:hypothetical protein n=1 Tax=Microbacterium sp. TaxID=51671 RepID=UPI002FE41E25